MSVDRPENDLELLLHVATDPLRFLGSPSLPLFEAFSLGYTAGLPDGARFHHMEAPRFEDFVRERFGLAERWPPHLSATSYVHFLGETDAAGFDLYVTLRRGYFAAHPAPPEEPKPVEGADFAQMLAGIRRRPRMYFGLTPDPFSSFLALLNGGIEAQLVHTGASSIAAGLNEFGLWINERHPWALGRPWHRILQFQNLWDPDRSLTAFFTFFDLFRLGEPPDALTPVAKQMFETNRGLSDMSEEQRAEWKRKLSQIFYTE